MQHCTKSLKKVATSHIPSRNLKLLVLLESMASISGAYGRQKAVSAGALKQAMNFDDIQQEGVCPPSSLSKALPEAAGLIVERSNWGRKADPASLGTR